MSKNPFQIAIAENQHESAWDITVMIGGFKTKEDVEKAAEVLAEWLADCEDGWSSRMH